MTRVIRRLCLFSTFRVLLCKIIRGPDSFQYLSWLIWRICKQFLNYLSNRLQQIITWHWKSLLTLGVLYRLSEKHSPLLHIASSCELQMIYRYKRAQTFRFGFCDTRNDQGRGKRFYLGFKCTKYNLGKSETKIVACNMQTVKRLNRLDVQQKNLGL